MTSTRKDPPSLDWIRRGCGGTGRRARFRSVCPKGRGGSTPFSRIRKQVSGAALEAVWLVGGRDREHAAPASGRRRCREPSSSRSGGLYEPSSWLRSPRPRRGATAPVHPEPLASMLGRHATGPSRSPTGSSRSAGTTHEHALVEGERGVIADPGTRRVCAASALELSTSPRRAPDRRRLLPATATSAGCAGSSTARTGRFRAGHRSDS